MSNEVGNSRSVGASQTKSATIIGTAEQKTVGGVTGQGIAEGDVKSTFTAKPVEFKTEFSTSNGSLKFMQGAALSGEGAKTVTTTGMKSLTLGVTSKAQAELQVDVTSRVGAVYETGLVSSEGKLDLQAKEK